VTAAERLGAHALGMTAAREAKLCCELGVPYCLLTVSSNWAAGRHPGDPTMQLSHEEVSEVSAGVTHVVVECLTDLLKNGLPDRSKPPPIEVSDEEIARQAAGLIDHTSLGDNDTEDMIQKLVDAAVAEAPHTAAVCVYPKFVPFIRGLQKKDPKKYPRTLRVATVVNFPQGSSPSDEVVAATKQTVVDGADEVDMVIDYKHLKRDITTGKAAAEALVRAVRAACPSDTVKLKVIIETGELQTPELIAAASDAALAAGADFIKTSTGKVKVNATLEAADVMLRRIAFYRAANPGCRILGFKAAGGVKTLEQAHQYLNLAAECLCGGRNMRQHVDSNLFRFGSSGLLPVLRQKINESVGGATSGGQKRKAEEPAY